MARPQQPVSGPQPFGRRSFGAALRPEHAGAFGAPIVSPRPGKSLRARILSAIGPTLIAALGVGVVASAQSSSPFASKKKKQAWETPAASQPAPAPAPIPAPTAAPSPAPNWQLSTPSVPAQTTPSQAAPIYTPPTYRAPAPSPTPSQTSSQAPAPLAGARPSTSPFAPPANQAPAYDQNSFGQPGYGQAQPTYGQPAYGQPSAQTPIQPQRPRSWKDRFGLSNLSTILRGSLRAGAAATERTPGGWSEDFIVDGDVEGEVSAITQGGVEYGLNAQVRAQYDRGRKGFARRLPDCPPTLAGCASVVIDGTPVALRGHTAQAYTFGPDVSDDVEIALESAHLFLRTAYGDVTVGRDDGAAYLFSLGAPSLLAVGASNSPVDYTGLDTVKTVNDASGFAEKVTYTSPRLLGDQIGVGVQFGVSYALDPNVCGVDYCVDPDGIAGVLTPDLEDVFEAGLALDRTFENGLSVEGTVTYARGSEQSGLAAFVDLESYGAGIEVKLSDWTVGGSWLTSNQGLTNGDYEAYDIGLTWQPSALGFTLGYGHATDDLLGLTSDQFVGGVTYQYNDRITLGAGVQHADRESLRDTGATAATLGREKATSVFVEAGITF